MVINRPHFNIVVSQEVERLGQGERLGNFGSVEKSEHTQHYQLGLLF